MTICLYSFISFTNILNIVNGNPYSLLCSRIQFASFKICERPAGFSAFLNLWACSYTLPHTQQVYLHKTHVMGRLKYFQIKLENNPPGVFFGGDVVRGRIFIGLEGNVKIRQVVRKKRKMQKHANTVVIHSNFIQMGYQQKQTWSMRWLEMTSGILQ